MNILHLCTRDYGGAAKAALRLHQNLLNAGHNSLFLVKESRGSSIPRVRRLRQAPPSLSSIVKERMIEKFGLSKSSPTIQFDPKYQFYNLDETIQVIDTNQFVNHIDFTPHAIILHWVTGYVNASNISELHAKYNCPIYWYLLDMSPLTGGCHYAWDCNGYETNCMKCPAITNPQNSQVSFKNIEFRKKWFKDVPIRFVPPSHSLDVQAKKSAISINRVVEKIPLAIDDSIFRPVNSEVAREILGLPHDKTLLFFGAESPEIERKGAKYLIEALALLAQDVENLSEIEVVSAGNQPLSSFADFAFKEHHLGYLIDDRSLALGYQSADLFLCPSIEDSGPMMINESLMCGTPVVSFQIGVAPDLVVDYRSGFMASEISGHAFFTAISNWMDLSVEAKMQMRESSYTYARSLLDPKLQIEQFITLIESDLANGSF